MTLDPKLVESMLQRTEDNFLDFKRKQYSFDNNRQISSFVKDLLTMANTPRTDSAYIVIGVGESNGRPAEIVGTQEHIDPAEVDRKLQDKVNAVPSIEYHVAEYKGCELGIYEIKVDYSGPFVPSKTFERLTPGSIFFRRNSQNVVATTTDDIERIVEWFNAGKPTDEPHFVDGASWQQFYRSCDGFDDRRAYICVLDEDTDTTEDGWRSFSALGWDLVIDFDILTNESGAYSKCSESLSKLRSLKLTPLDGERPVMGPGASLWVAARGIRSRPTTVQEGTWREWHREKLTYLRDATEAVARISDIKPTTVVIFSGDPDYVRSVCEQIDDNFRDRVRFVFASHRNGKYSAIIETFEGDDVPISFGEACHHIGELRHTGSETPGVEIPKLEGGVVPIQLEMVRWLEEELDLLHLPTDLTPDDIQSEIKSFHRGNQISWYGLNAGIDIRRDGLDEVERRIREGLTSRSVRRLDLSHWPGGGGSTIGRRLAWNIHTDFPAAIAHTVNPESTLDRIRYLFDISNLPVLVIIDSPSATTNDLDRLFNLVRGSNVWATIVRVVRHYGDTQRHRPTPFLDAMLSTQESLALEERLSALVPDQRSALHSLSRIEDRRRRTPFNYGITAYGRNFQGIETYVSSRLERCNPHGKLVCLISSLVYHYGQQSIPLQLLAKRLGIPQSKVISLSDVVDEFVEDLFVSTSGRVRPIHDLIAEEILRQLLGRDLTDENWKTGIADAAITLAEICEEQVAISGTRSPEILHTVILERNAEEFDADFSRLLKDVPSPEAQERILTTLTDLFPTQPHFWAHLGRFRSLVTRNHQMAHDCHRTAIELAPSDPTLHHMAGMSLRAQLYDLLNQSQGGMCICLGAAMGLGVWRECLGP